ncbi:unnamed protein product, partial [Symbiodinium pilosum]
ACGWFLDHALPASDLVLVIQVLHLIFQDLPSKAFSGITGPVNLHLKFAAAKELAHFLLVVAIGLCLHSCCSSRLRVAASPAPAPDRGGGRKPLDKPLGRAKQTIKAD